MEKGEFKGATLILHGTKTKPSHMKNGKIYRDEDLVEQTLDPVPVITLQNECNK